MIFVFGSNLAGIHGAGAALTARRQYGAIPRIGFGAMGQSYAIPTKDSNLRTLPLHSIQGYVDIFLTYAAGTPECNFQVTRVGCGLAGYMDEQIAPMFRNAPENCFFDKAWKPILEEGHSYWGTF